MTIDIRPAPTRFHTDFGWLDSWHCFSFGQHYDPSNLGHGLLIVSNDDRVAPGAGFSAHPHRDMEIVTWVLEGELAHEDSAGHVGLIRPGLAQRMSAGTGIMHSEMNASPDLPVHFVQMWVPPDVDGVAPGYEQADVTDRLEAGELVPVAGPAASGAAVTIHQAGATMWAVRLAAGQSVTVPFRPFLHLFVARGGVELEGLTLGEGDAARLTEHPEMEATATGPTELIIWGSNSAAR